MTIEKLEKANTLSEELKELSRLNKFLVEDRNAYVFASNSTISDAVKLPDEIKKDIREIILNYEAKVRDQFENL